MDILISPVEDEAGEHAAKRNDIMRSGSMVRFGRLAICTAVSALALTACSSKSEEKAADTTTTASATDTAAPAAATPAPAAAPAASGAPAADNTDTTDGTKLASFTGDATKGEAAFVACKTCHDPVQNKIGPHLAGVVGRKAGSVADYTYSAANKNSGITWSPDKLFQYLQAPQRVVPGTKMAFSGIPDAQKRADVIAYLATLK
ncbi:MAG: c-type cytochrome [Pseudomonadota bacterium]